MKKLGILLFLFSFSVLSLQGVTKNKTEVNKVDFNKEYQKLKVMKEIRSVTLL